MPRKKKTRGRPSRLANASLAELQAEIHRRQTTLQARRDELALELAAIDEAIAGMGAAPGRRRGRPRKAAAATRRRGRPPGRRKPGRPAKKKRGRPRGRRAGGGPSLIEALHKTLQGRTLSVGDAMYAVQKAGYKTKSANFRTIVNQALSSNTKRFKKVARGQYTAK